MTMMVMFAMDDFRAKPVTFPDPSLSRGGARLWNDAGDCHGGDAAAARNDLFDPRPEAGQIGRAA